MSEVITYTVFVCMCTTGTFIQTWWLNQYRLVPIAFIDQLIMSYGGLRGAVAYGLATMLDDQRIKEKKLMIGTTLIVVYFTVILQVTTFLSLYLTDRNYNIGTFFL